MERAFGLHPVKPDQERLPKWQNFDNGHTLGFSRDNLNEGFSLGVLWSESLEEGDWLPLSDVGDASDFEFALPQTESGRAFGRFQVWEN